MEAPIRLPPRHMMAQLEYCPVTANKYQGDFLGMMMDSTDIYDENNSVSETLPALSYDMITFEPSNGWATVMGDGDRMAGTGAPYGGGAYTSSARALSAPTLMEMPMAKSFISQATMM